MKVGKNNKAEQRNVRVNTEYYTRRSLIALLADMTSNYKFTIGYTLTYTYNGITERADELEEIITMLNDYSKDYDKFTLFIALTVGDKLEVSIDEYGYFTTTLERVDFDDSDIKHLVYIEL